MIVKGDILKIFAHQILDVSGVEVRGQKYFEEIGKLQRSFLKRLYELPRNTTNYILYLETGLNTLFIVIFNHILKIFFGDKYT